MGHYRRSLTPCLVGAVACLLYLATLSSYYSGDSIEYALAVESANRGLLLDPSHPLLHPAGLSFYRLWQLAGWTERALLPLQVLNALAGGVCAGLLTGIAGAVSGSMGIAAAAGLGFAVSGGPWMLSVDAEFVTLPLALMLVVLWLLLGASPTAASRNRYPLLLAAATAIAVLGYVNSVLLVQVVAVGLLTDGRLDAALRRRHCLIYLATALLLLVPFYLAFLAAWSGGDLRQAPAYFFGRSYGRFTVFNIPHGAYAFLRSLALYPNLSLVGTTRTFLVQASAAGRLLFAAYYAAILLAVLAPLGLAWRHRQRLWPTQRQPLLVLGTWTALLAAFGFYWVPGDQSFWLPVLAAWWLLVALVLEAAQVGGLRLAMVLVVVAGLAAGNALFEIVPRHDIRRNTAHRIVQQVLANTTPDEILLVRADDITGRYLDYWSDRQIVTVFGEQESPAELLSRAARTEAATRSDRVRLIVVDSESRRAGWWLARLGASGVEAPGSWRASIPRWHTEGGLVLEAVRE